MDATLSALFTSCGVPDHAYAQRFAAQFVEPYGELALKARGKVQHYTLKPLKELFAATSSAPSFDLNHPQHLALTFAIEHEILICYERDSSLTDGLVSLSLSRLCQDPALDPGQDAVCRQVQLGLRLRLSLSDLSRDEVKQALRKILKSVERHTKESGITGYLDFIKFRIDKMRKS